MKDEKNIPNKQPEEIENIDDMDMIEVMTLTDDDGNEHDFELIHTEVIDGQTYVALVPIDDDSEEEPDEYLLLKMIQKEGEEEAELLSIEDDAEFEKVEAIFDEKLAAEYDYDEEAE